MFGGLFYFGSVIVHINWPRAEEAVSQQQANDEAGASADNYVEYDKDEGAEDGLNPCHSRLPPPALTSAHVIKKPKVNPRPKKAPHTVR